MYPPQPRAAKESTVSPGLPGIELTDLWQRLYPSPLGALRPLQSVAVGPRSGELAARILVVDDNSAARTAIRSLLDLNSFHVCGEARDGNEAIEKVGQLKLKPDIVLLDINMPGMNGVTAASRIRKMHRTKIVFLTIHKLPGTVLATRHCSDGFVSKSAAATELIPTLIRVARSVDGFTRRTTSRHISTS